MKNATYGVLATAIFLCFYMQFWTVTPSPLSSSSTTSQGQAYSQTPSNRNDTLPGTYQTSNSVTGFKDLILDSTYTYRYSVSKPSGESVVLEGSWELSYKDQDQQIVLHQPLPNEAWEDLKIAHLEEHRFKVTPNGLRDLYTQEVYLQLKTNEYSLAIFNQ
ncbi:hypothetical protein [Aureispira sp. CCB-QB1]|uniref:hypothetical protein n=1 Tax=Aureispira sp. CCB-QB1 TaxID=1313421 RepID=UPI000697C49B|nr:hypothetical protein [Aureispira sp. CCB-QB1]